MGKVWQVTACDAASSYGTGRVFVAAQPTAQIAARFLRHVLVPLYREAGWPIQRVLTDGGSEFKRELAQSCRDLAIRHTRTQPRHAWTNGFVERLQGTILREHWRIEFRRRYFTRLGQLDASLQSFLRFYNHGGNCPDLCGMGQPVARSASAIQEHLERLMRPARRLGSGAPSRR